MHCSYCCCFTLDHKQWRWFTVFRHYVLYLNTFLFTQKVAFEATMWRLNSNKCFHILQSCFSKMMVSHLGKFGTTIYHGVCTWVSEWVSEWVIICISESSWKFSYKLRVPQVKSEQIFDMSKLKLPEGCTCEEYPNR